MPYIESKTDRRERLKNGEPALTAGELNYQIFYYIKHNLDTWTYEKIIGLINRFLGKTPNYQKYNDITGVLIRCAREIERRIDHTGYYEECFKEILSYYDKEIAKYEDLKCLENGDVE